MVQLAALIALLGSPALAGDPIDLKSLKKVAVQYKMSTSSGTTCATTYTGSGKARAVDATHVTFKGEWAVGENTCGDTVWVPEDGKAFHTLRLTADGTQIEEWVVHGREEDNTRFVANIKAQGQYWINELAASIPADRVVKYQTTEVQGIGPIKVELQHELTLTFE